MEENPILSAKVQPETKREIELLVEERKASGMASFSLSDGIRELLTRGLSSERSTAGWASVECLHAIDGTVGAHDPNTPHGAGLILQRRQLEVSEQIAERLLAIHVLLFEAMKVE